MRKIGAVLALTAAVACVAVLGLKFMGGSSSSLGGIAVVDLDKVAKETGKTDEMREALKLQENSYNQRLVGFRDAAITQLRAEAKEIEKLEEKNKDLDEKNEIQIDKKELDTKKYVLTAKVQQANTILSKAQNEAGSALNQSFQVQIAKFRAELKPLVQEAAAKRGLSVVIPKNDGLLLSVEPGVDITDDVIKAYKAKRPAPTAAASAPTVPAPTTSAPTAATQKATPADQDDEVPAPAATQSATAPVRQKAKSERAAPAPERTISAETASDEDASSEKPPVRRKQTNAKRNKPADADSEVR